MDSLGTTEALQLGFSPIYDLGLNIIGWQKQLVQDPCIWLTVRFDVNIEWPVLFLMSGPQTINSVWPPIIAWAYMPECNIKEAVHAVLIAFSADDYPCDDYKDLFGNCIKPYLPGEKSCS